MNAIKKVLSYIQAKRYRITYRRGVFIHPTFRSIGQPNIYVNENVVLHSNTLMDCGTNGTIICDCGVHINSFTRIEAENKVYLGKDVLIGPNVYISDRNHNYENINQPIIGQGYYSRGEVRMESGTWIGIHSAIVGNVRIGKNCVIGANTVITKDIPDYSVVVGNPARIIKTYNRGTNKWEKNRTGEIDGNSN